MSEELYNKIIQHFKESTDKSILDKITDIEHTEIDNYYVIQVYIKESMKSIEMGEVLSNIEDYAEENDCAVVVDFLRG